MKTKVNPLAPKIIELLAQNDVDGLEKLLAGQDVAEIVMNSDGAGILHIAALASEDPLLIISLLNKFPSLIDTIDKEGKTVMHYATDKSLIRLFEERKPGIKDILDNFGNSPLYYTTLADDTFSKAKLELLFKMDALFIKSGKQTKTPLHIKIGLDEPFSPEDLPYLNSPDEYGKTPLHYALALRKKESIEELLEQKGIDINIPDYYGKTPFHYMILTGAVSSQKIKEYLQTPNLITEDSQELSIFAMACYSKNKEIYQLIKDSPLYQKTEFDLRIISAIENFDYKELDLYTEGLNEKQKFIMLAALRSTQKGMEFFIDDYAKNYLHSKIDVTKFKKGKAIGIELELANIPEFALIPTHILIDWFYFHSTPDNTVRPPLLMATPNEILPSHSMDIVYEELVSEPLLDKKELQNALQMCGILQDGGAMVGNTTGLHIHYNVNEPKFGSIADCLTIPEKYSKEQIELEIVKQIMANFAQIEPLLKGFLRGGNAYDSEYERKNFFGGNMIAPFLSDFKKCQSFADIGKVKGYSRESTINALSIYGTTSASNNKQHGTLEFRFHEGSIDPQIIGAWINLLDRLVEISIHQVEKKIYQNQLINTPTDRSDIVPYDGIENLVYILMAERNYQTSWDADLGSTKSSYIPPSTAEKRVGRDHEILQESIGKSPLYNLFQLAIGGGDVKTYYKENVETMPETEKNQIMKDFIFMVDIVKKYPGLPGVKIEKNILDTMDQPSYHPEKSIFAKTQINAQINIDELGKPSTSTKKPSFIKSSESEQAKIL